ncbi:MAG: hypothetical protein WC490_04390 [Candidatus Margulisiibacteriota bacterium]
MKIWKAIIAGIVGAIVYVVFSTLANFIFSLGLILIYGRQVVHSWQNYSLYKEVVLHPTLMWMVMLYLGYIILAIPCVFIYSALQKSIPGRNFISKGLLAGIVAWYFNTVMRMFWEHMAVAVADVFIVADIIMQFAGLAAAGIVIAFIYERFGE